MQELGYSIRIARRFAGIWDLGPPRLDGSTYEWVVSYCILNDSGLVI